MKQILASFLATSLMAAVAASAAEGGASEVRAVDRSISAAVVLTPQGVERQARAVPGPSPAIPNKTEVGAPTWSSGQTWLKYREMDIYPDREHWLGGVYVPTSHRGREVGSRVVERVVEKARSLEVPTLHPQTDRLDGGLYRRLGWKEPERVSYRGREVLVMERRLLDGDNMQ